MKILVIFQNEFFSDLIKEFFLEEKIELTFVNLTVKSSNFLQEKISENDYTIILVEDHNSINREKIVEMIYNLKRETPILFVSFSKWISDLLKKESFLTSSGTKAKVFFFTKREKGNEERIKLKINEILLSENFRESSEEIIERGINKLYD